MRRALSFLTLFLPLSVAATAEADPVTITGGSLYAAGWFVVSPPSTVTGTDGFRLVTTLAVGGANGRLDPLNFCDGTDLCAPGDRLNVGGHLDAFDGGLIRTSVTLGGVEYEVDGSDYALLLQPTGFFTVPAFGSTNDVTVRAPFTLTGFFSDNIIGVSTPLSGRGTATIKLMRSANADLPGWERSSVRYDFDQQSVVPEPSSMLLLGSGLAGVIAARARRRRALPHT